MGACAAGLMGTLGIRRTMLCSLGLVAVGVALTALMTAPWQLVLLWGVVVGGGTGMTAVVLGAVVVSRWFATRQGLVLAMLNASTATRQISFLSSVPTISSR